MVVFAIVPVKRLSDSKKRLSTVFTQTQRRQLTLAMLNDVLYAVKSSTVEGTIVVAEDTQVRRLAEKFGAFYLELKHVSLNEAIEEGQSFCIQKGATSILALPADIPLTRHIDIDGLIQLSKGDRESVVLSPSQNWGTNALCQKPPKLIRACFGPASFLNHILEAYQKGISVRLHFSPRLAVDVDSAEDLRNVFEAENSTLTKSTLERILTHNRTVKDLFICNLENKKGLVAWHTD